MATLDVLHVCFGGLGGHMAVINTLTKELAPRGITSGVVAVGSEDVLITSEQAWPDVDLLELVILKGRGDLSSMVHAFGLARTVRARVVLVHTHRHATPIALGRFASGQPLKLVTIEHHSLNLRSASDNVNSFSSLLWSRAVVFLTEEYGKRYPLRRFKLPGLSLRAVIANGTNLTAFESIHQPLYEATRAPVFGMAARLVPGKDVDTLLEAMAILICGGDQPHPQLRLAGDGPERQRLEKRVSELGLGQAVSFVGRIPENQMRDFLGDLDVYVLSTLAETLNTSLLQAAASRVPIVATRVEGVADIFTDQLDALLVDRQDPQSLAAALSAASDPVTATRLSAAGYQLVSTRYSSVTMALSYLKLLARIDPSGPWEAARATVKDVSPPDPI
jgi:glycosyltransferase involved in cell wall biosynthesis